MLTPQHHNRLKHAYFEATGYVPHAAQEQIHSSMARFLVAVCGRRFGKSLLAAKEALALLCNSALPNKRIWVVAPTYTLTEKVFREAWDEAITKGGLHPDQISKKSLNDRIIRTTWGSEILGKSADNPDSLVGDALDLLIMDEAAKIKQSVWEKNLRPTLTDRKGRALFITTPEGTNWIESLYNRGFEDEHPDWDAFKFVSLSNPHLPAEDIEEARKTLTEETFRQEYEADFVTFAGQVYKHFNKLVHVISEPLTRHDFDYVIAGLDFGFVNPTTVQILGVKDSRYTVVAELYKSEMHNRELSSELVLLQGTWGFRKIYADHDAEKIKYLQKKGFHVIKAKKDVTAGIEKVASKLKLAGDGKPSLLFHVSCKHSIAEHEGYRYAETKELQNDKEEPIKDRDHTCDAVRYAIFTHEHKGGSVRSGRIKGYM